MLPMPLPPRDIDGRNPKNAKTDLSMFSFGKDGILYKCDNEREWQKYKTISPELDQKSSSLSLMMIDKLSTMRGHVDTVSLSRKKGLVLKSPPRFGIVSKSMKIEKRSWDKALNMATNNRPGSESNSIRPLDSNSQLVIDAIVSNTLQRGVQSTTTVAQPLHNNFTQSSHIPSAIGTAKSANIDGVASIIQSKYEQNLRVVEKLFEEKKAMEERMKVMEAELRRTQASSILLKENSTGEESAESIPAPPTYDELFGQESFERGRTRYGVRGNDAAPRNHSSSSPDLYARDVSPLIESHRSRSLSAVRSSARWKRRTGGVHTRSLSRSRSRSCSGPRHSDDPDFHLHQERLRALSASRVSGGGLSRSLQADTDRYIQRKKAAEDKEWEQKLQQEFYESWLEQRFRKASENGTAFADMMERAKKAEESAKIRADKKAMRELEKEAEEEAKKKKRIQTALEKAKESFEPYKDLTWEQLQTLQTAKRKERIEARQRQLLSESELPPSLTQSMNRVDSSKSAVRVSKSLEIEKPYQFRATDPETVARKLASMQHGWKVKEANDKQRQLEQKEARKQTLAADERVVEAMKQRRDTSRTRKEARLKEKKEQEDLQEAKRLQAEKSKTEKLLQAKLPPPLLTKSVEIQKEKMLREKELRQREEDKSRRDKDRKERELKETAAALQVAISEREIERRNNGYVELRNSESLKEAAVQAREEYRRKLRENKQRIRDSLAARPSLLDRHDKSLATKAAASQALQKVAVAVTGGDFSEEKFQSAIDDDDLFGDREKAILGMSKSALEETRK